MNIFFISKNDLISEFLVKMYMSEKGLMYILSTEKGLSASLLNIYIRPFSLPPLPLMCLLQRTYTIA